jgi:DNA-binding protein HU-beta
VSPGSQKFSGCPLFLIDKKTEIKQSQPHFSGNPFPRRKFIMTKAELVEQMANDAGITKTAAETALQSMIDGITQALKGKEGKVTLVGFGTFQKVRRKARTGRNPQTGESIKIKASNSVKFKPGKKLKEEV